MARLLLAALVALATAASPVALARDVIALGDIRVEELPAEARETLALIKRGGPFPYRKDGAVFEERDALLNVFRDVAEHYAKARLPFRVFYR